MLATRYCIPVLGAEHSVLYFCPWCWQLGSVFLPIVLTIWYCIPAFGTGKLILYSCPWYCQLSSVFLPLVLAARYCIPALGTGSSVLDSCPGAGNISALLVLATRNCIPGLGAGNLALYFCSLVLRNLGSPVIFKLSFSAFCHWLHPDSRPPIALFRMKASGFEWHDTLLITPS